MCVGEHLQEQKTKNEYSVKTQNTQEQYEQTKDHGMLFRQRKTGSRMQRKKRLTRSQRR